MYLYDPDNLTLGRLSVACAVGPMLDARLEDGSALLIPFENPALAKGALEDIARSATEGLPIHTLDSAHRVTAAIEPPERPAPSAILKTDPPRTRPMFIYGRGACGDLAFAWVTLRALFVQTQNNGSFCELYDSPEAAQVELAAIIRAVECGKHVYRLPGDTD